MTAHRLGVACLAIVYLGFACATVAAAQGTWEPTNGPYGGRVHDLQVTPSGTIFAGVEVDHYSHDPDSGAYRSDDGGRTWRRVAVPQLGEAPQRFAYGGGTLYALDRYSLVASGDEGLSWRRVQPPAGLWPVVANDDALFVASVGYTERGFGPLGVLFRSTDDGATWAKAFETDTMGQILSAAFHGDDLYVGAESGLFRSSDLGATWTDTLAEGSVTAILSTPEGVTIAVEETGWLSAADPAEGWDDANADPRYQYVSALVAHDGERYAATRGGSTNRPGAGVLRLGAEAADVGSPGLTDFVVTDIVSTGDGLLAATYNDGVFRSADGVTWQPSNEGMPAYWGSVETFDGALYTNDYRSTDRGDTWAKDDLRLPFSDVRSHIKHGRVEYVTRWAVGGVWGSHDGGATWAHVIPDDDALILRSVSHSGDHLALLTGQGLYMSGDGGHTLRPVANPLEDRGVTLIGYTGAGLFLTDLDGRIRRSTDHGESWETLPRAPLVGDLFPSQRIRALVEIGDRMLAVVSSRLFARPVAGGAWQQVDMQAPYASALSTAGGEAFLTSGASVYRSADEGRTWRRGALPLHTSILGAVAVVDGWMYAGTGDGVYRAPLEEEAPVLPTLDILSPTPHAILPNGDTAVEVHVDLGDYAGPWRWRVDEPFPDSGPAGGVPAEGATASVDGLAPGRMHTLHVAPVTADGMVIHPHADRSVVVYAPVLDWRPGGDIGSTLIAATVDGDRILVVQPDGAARLDIESPVRAGLLSRTTPAW